MGAGSYFQGEKQPRLEADHSSAPTAEVRNKRNYNSIPLYASMACIWSHYEIICIITQYNELKHIRDTVVVAYFRYYTGIYLNGLTVRILGVPSEIQTLHPAITRHNYHCTRQPKSLREHCSSQMLLCYIHTQCITV